MITVIDHGDYDHKSGTRILMIKGRAKDGCMSGNLRTILRVTHNPTQWDRAIDELLTIIRPGERIYATAGARSISRASREFKRRQLDADYDPDPELFYREIENRWTSCLMAPISQEIKVWLIDLDTPVEAMWYYEATTFLSPLVLHEYATKNGRHVLIKPFHRDRLPEPKLGSKIHDNALMLIAY